MSTYNLWSACCPKTGYATPLSPRFVQPHAINQISTVFDRNGELPRSSEVRWDMIGRSLSNGVIRAKIYVVSQSIV